MARQHLPMAFGGCVLLSQMAGMTGLARVAFVAAGTLAGVLPDVDHKGTMANVALLGGVDVIPGHRGWTHSVAGGLLFAGVAGSLVWWLAGATVALTLAAAVFAGCMAHLAGDTVTHAGVPWLWPGSRRWAWHWFATGGQAGLRDRVLERVVAYGFTLACVGLALLLDNS
jgi:membrane-bound metal-dependent hydrolase YbcI (DUF457 family)